MAAARISLPFSKLAPPVPAMRRVEMTDVLRQMEKGGRGFDPVLLRDAHELATEMHRGQTRRSGEPYVSHPIAVAYLLAEQGFDDVCVAVGLLHDVLEDTPADFELLTARFGSSVAELVDGVTKIGRHPYVRKDQAQAETYRKLILASAKDLRVILVKLADRLHNMMTLEAMSAEPRRRISTETLEIYAPIAHRLGMSRVQGDLQDLAFFYRDPQQFADLKRKIDSKMRIGRVATERIHAQLKKSLAEAEIDAEINYRVKRYYSIHRKLIRQEIEVSELHDYLAFRVITGDLKDCYGSLGVVHQNWRPIPGRFKDYIAMPKPNLYQSLHTVVVGDSGQPFEVQLRTKEMDLIAEEGIAAHWRFKEGRTEAKPSDPNIRWLRQVIELQKEVEDSRAFLADLKIELYPDEVYAFTPKGEVLSLPRGATALDFAYKVHTELGHHCVGARINGRQQPLKKTLHNGDIVEARTDPTRKPSRDWLNFVVTSRAKSKIRNWINSEQKRRAIEIGRKLLEKEARRGKVSLKRVIDSPELADYLAEEGISSYEELLSRVGFGRLTARQALGRWIDDSDREAEEAQPSALRKAVNKLMPFHGDPIQVRGQNDLLAYLAKCCDPLPGEEIVGYITRGRGVSVHSPDCPNVKRLLFNPEREIPVEWAPKDDGLYPVSLVIETDEQRGMLAKLTDAISRHDANIRRFQADAFETKGAIEVVVEVRNRRQLEKVRKGIANLKGVRVVDRRVGRPKRSAQVDDSTTVS